MPRPSRLVELPARLTIVRRGGYDDKMTVEVEIMDDRSRTLAARFELPLAQFTYALFGLASVPGTLLFNASGTVGLAHETRDLEVFVPDGSHRTAKLRAERAIREREDEGWRGRVADGTNPHRRQAAETRNGVKGAVYRVFYERWVDDDGKALEFSNDEEEEDDGD